MLIETPGLSIRQAVAQLPEAQRVDLPDLAELDSKRFRLSPRNPIEEGRGQLYAANPVYAEWTTNDILVFAGNGELAIMLGPSEAFRLVDLGYFCQATSGATHKITGVTVPSAKTEAECGGNVERLAVLVKPNPDGGTQVNFAHAGHTWTFDEVIVHELSV